MNIQPIGDRILIRPVKPEEKSQGGIVLPDVAQEQTRVGTVIAIGRGRVAKKGLVPVSVKVGDKILHSEHAGTPIKTRDGEDLLILRDEDIIAIVR